MTINARLVAGALVLLSVPFVVACTATTQAPAEVVVTEPTSVPTEVATEAVPPTEDLYPGWEAYDNPDYGFAFRFPPSWTLEEQPNLLTLKQGPYVVGISFHREGEEVTPPWTGMPAGELENRGTVSFMGQEVDRTALVFEDRVKVLTYQAAVDDLLFAVRVDDFSEGDYAQLEIPASIQDQVEQILSSFEPTALQ